MRDLLPSHHLVEVAKVFAYKDALCFKRLSADTFFVPLFNTPCSFDIALNESHNVSFTPVSLSLKATKSLHSVRDLLNKDTLVSRAIFTCFYDPKFILSDPRWQTTINVAYNTTVYALNCKVYVPKYEKFYGNLLHDAERKHVTVRVENVKVTSKRYQSP